MHQQLKDDLVEHIWRKFGRDGDNYWARMFFQIILDYCTSLYFYVFFKKKSMFKMLSFNMFELINKF